MTRRRDAGGLRPAELVLAASIARSFYLEGWSKVDIAAETGMSRFKVARLLEEARRRGLVRVDIQLPGALDGDLSVEVRRALGLRRVVVIAAGDGSAVPSASDAGYPTEPDSALRQRLAEVTAELLAEIVADGDVLGLTWSRTIELTSAALRHLASCTVVQLAGTLTGPDRGTSAVEIVRRAAAASGGDAYPIYAPMVLPDEATAASLRTQHGIREALDRFGDVTKAVVAIGAWAEGHSTVWEALAAGEREAYRAAGACAEISARLLDASGSELAYDLDRRVIAVTPTQLRAVPEVIAIAAGSYKAEAVSAAVRSGLVSTLVTDATLARRLLEMQSLGTP